MRQPAISPMTPEEKAKELLFQMKRQQRGPGIEAAQGNAKRSAIVCCDEILAYLEDAVTIIYEDGGERLDPAQFWKQVKLHIQSL